MHLAALGGHNRIAELILDHQGSSIDVTDNDGKSLLHLAVLSNNVATVELFLRKGALTEVLDKDNNTPLHLALKGGFTHIAELIIGQLEGSPINAIDNDGNSPLHLAAQKGYYGLVYLLISKGASHSAVNKNNQSPYSLAPDSDTRSNFQCWGIWS